MPIDVPLLLDQTRALLGAHLSHGGVTVRITEVEAYAGEVDPGSHAYRGRTNRNAVMFGPPRHLYVYFTYGMHYCANVVLSQDGSPAAALIRAGEVIAGTELARQRRGAVTDRDLARGPARLAQALGLTLADDDAPILSSARDEHAVTLGEAAPVSTIESGPRVGVRGPGGDGQLFPWRFWIAGDSFVSVYRPATPRPRSGI